MPLTETIIDILSARTLTFQRISSSFDSEGNSTSSTYTNLTTVTGEIQPITINAKNVEDKYATVENVDEITHVGFVKTRISGVKVKDYILDTDGQRYEIVFITYQSHSYFPQEFDLKLKSDQDG